MGVNSDLNVEPDPEVIAELEAIEREEEGNLSEISVEDAFHQARQCLTDLRSLDELQATSKE